MKYIFLAYRDKQQWQALSAAEREALEQACLANEQDLQQSGYLLAVEGLQGNHTAITVRVENGKVSLTDGPFAETSGQSGQLIRLFCIQARDLNEAIQVAAKMPQALTGPIEVRPVTQDNQPLTF